MERGADMLGWTLDDLITQTIEAGNAVGRPIRGPLRGFASIMPF